MAQPKSPQADPIHYLEPGTQRFECGLEPNDDSEPLFSMRVERVTCERCLRLLDETEPEVLDRDGRVVRASRRVERAARSVNRAARSIGKVADAADGARKVLDTLENAGPIVRRKTAETIRECGGALELALGILGGNDETKRRIEREIKRKFGGG